MVCVPSFHTQTEILGGGLVQTDNGPAAILSLQTVDMQLQQPASAPKKTYII